MKNIVQTIKICMVGPTVCLLITNKPIKPYIKNKNIINMLNF